MKAKHCDECIHFHNPSEIRPRAGCAMGHKPRFYKPKNLHCVVFVRNWGWKRKCDDFKGKSDKEE